ncbi:DUF2066 domain-containing protein [Shewanella sp. YIC-542]|uniref:DUF2066 domain-containing protein n=1 Tax=Shewanella mytili TaxID=3377111 RepID=UPI00398E45B0
MRKILLQLMMGFGLLTASAANGVEVAQLDQAVVNVDSRTDAQRDAAIREALTSVLLKNSGARSVLNNAMIAECLSQASAMVSQFGYFSEQGQLKLRAQFDHDKIVRLLRAAGEPVWGRQRPLTVFWLAADIDNQPQIVADSVTSDIRQLFSHISEQRGMPLLFPLMDLDDLQTVNVNDVRGQFASPVAQASARYQADYFALASMQSSADGIYYQIALYNSSTVPEQAFMRPLLSEQNTVASQHDAVAAMMLALSEYFVSRYAVADSGASQQTVVNFAGVNQQQLVEIEGFLKQLTAVKSFAIRQLQGNRVSYQLQLFGSVAELKNLLGLESRISLLPPAATGALTDNNADTYEWHSR